MVMRARLPGTSPVIMAMLMAGGLCAPDVLAQSTESLYEPIGHHSGGDVHAVDETPSYVVPDFAPAKAADPNKELPFFKIRLGLSLIGDWTDFSQDAVNESQIGRQEDEFQVRSARLSLIGSVGGDYRVSYQVSGEYKGFDTNPEQKWKLTDASLTFPLGSRTKMTLGKTKETFSYEMVGDSANLPHSERVLTPFFTSRNFGVRFVQVLGANKAATFSAGAYKDSWDFGSSTDRGWDYSARMTGLIWDRPDHNEFLHVGMAYRHAAADGTIRYSGRAETNVGDVAIDTGKFAAQSSDGFAGEALLNVGPVSFLGEYILNRTNSREFRDPVFHGWYVTGSWILTGETRPYDRNVGYARRVIPKGRWGAPELVARYSEMDLDDNGIEGGRFKKTMLGLNWWATTRWKFGATWGHTWLDRFGERGESDTVLTRIQWIY